MSIYMQYAPYKLKNSDWESATQTASARRW